MIFYFTGTGNSLWVAKALSEALDIVIVEHVCSDEKVFEKRFDARLHRTDFADRLLKL